MSGPSGRITATTSLPITPRSIAAGAGGIWITGAIEDVVARLDPRTSRIVKLIPVGRGASGIAVAAGSVWVANGLAGTVSRIDPLSNTIQLGRREDLETHTFTLERASFIAPSVPATPFRAAVRIRHRAPLIAATVAPLGERRWAVTTDVPAYEATNYDLPVADFSLRAFRDDILPRLGDAGLALVDVRSPAEFNGEIIAPPGMSETAQRAGHIPGAASIPWAQTVKEDGTFKDAADLRALYDAKGVTADKDIIAYCRIGERSSHSWFVLHELLGYERVRNYDGSWTEYGSLIGVPIEKPEAAASG